MAYKYLLELTSEEHMLFISEIAQLYGILTKKGEKNSRVVNLVLEEYRRLQNNKEYPVIYFEGRLDRIRVYPFSVYDPALRWFLGRVKLTHATQYTFYDGKTYNFMLGEPHPDLKI